MRIDLGEARDEATESGERERNFMRCVKMVISDDRQMTYRKSILWHCRAVVRTSNLPFEKFNLLNQIYHFTLLRITLVNIY